MDALKTTAKSISNDETPPHVDFTSEDYFAMNKIYQKILSEYQQWQKDCRLLMLIFRAWQRSGYSMARLSSPAKAIGSAIEKPVIVAWMFGCIYAVINWKQGLIHVLMANLTIFNLLLWGKFALHDDHIVESNLRLLAIEAMLDQCEFTTVSKEGVENHGSGHFTDIAPLLARFESSAQAIQRYETQLKDAISNRDKELMYLDDFNKRFDAQLPHFLTKTAVKVYESHRQTDYKNKVASKDEMTPLKWQVHVMAAMVAMMVDINRARKHWDKNDPDAKKPWRGFMKE